MDGCVCVIESELAVVYDVNLEWRMEKVKSNRMEKRVMRVLNAQKWLDFGLLMASLPRL